MIIKGLEAITLTRVAREILKADHVASLEEEAARMAGVAVPSEAVAPSAAEAVPTVGAATLPAVAALL